MAPGKIEVWHQMLKDRILLQNYYLAHSEHRLHAVPD
jgi:hypothetical protein